MQSQSLNLARSTYLIILLLILASGAIKIRLMPQPLPVSNLSMAETGRGIAHPLSFMYPAIFAYSDRQPLDRDKQANLLPQGGNIDYFAIKIGDTVSNGVPNVGAGNLEAPSSIDIYTFTASAGQKVLFDMQQVDATISSFGWTLTDPANNVVFSHPLYHDPLVTLTLGGEYKLTIAGGNSTQVGTYQFKLLNVPAPQQF